MTRNALIAALGLCLTLTTALWWVTGQRDEARGVADRLRADLATAQHRIDQAAQAAAVHRAYIDRMQAEATQAARDEDEALTMEGANAPLPDYLRTIIDRLR